MAKFAPLGQAACQALPADFQAAELGFTGLAHEADFALGHGEFRHGGGSSQLHLATGIPLQSPAGSDLDDTAGLKPQRLNQVER
ncbi:uncharacterized protein METZ01_LOCUS150170 [marine metagenome]|uniref:Uncharacterized protein n=1 Tax=marine metagenome TaxID=408172 RepID=A0A382A712_9ZZZZ